jgi:hypothetical protein
LIVPLVGRNTILGAISLYRDTDAPPFSTGDQSFLMDISHRIGLAIENYHLFESLREETARRLSTKQALAISEERFRSIFESVTLGIKVLDKAHAYFWMLEITLFPAFGLNIARYTGIIRSYGRTRSLPL